MAIKAVITGDIVNSTRDLKLREKLLKTLTRILDELAGEYPLKYEIYRGDSFQLVLDEPEDAAQAAVALRCALRSGTAPEARTIWDARISIGIGGVEYYGKDVVSSDGEAFRLSGHMLDEIKKRRFKVSTPWPGFNDAIEVGTSFLDNAVTGWTQQQSRLVLRALEANVANKTLAEEFKTTPQNLSKRLKIVQIESVRRYIEYFRKSVHKHVDE